MSDTLSKRLLAVDIETDGFRHELTKIHCICIEDIVYGTKWSFYGPSMLERFKKFIRSTDTLVGHNIIGFDWPVLKQFIDLPDTIELVDTLVLSRLFNAGMRDHSLRWWGSVLDNCKDDYKGGWETFNSEMLSYCVQDTSVVCSIYRFLVDKKKMLTKWGDSVKTESDAAELCVSINDNGMPFDITAARQLYKELTLRLVELDYELQKVFPTYNEVVKTVVVKAKANGDPSMVGVPVALRDMSKLNVGQEIVIEKEVVFNAASPSQIVSRLRDMGWPMSKLERTTGYNKAVQNARRESYKTRMPMRPVSDRLERYGYKINEHNLSLAPDETFPLLERLVISTRLSTLNEWFAAYREDTGRIHGSVFHIGAWTHRMAHIKPNVGNIAGGASRKYNTPKLKALVESLGQKMRRFWVAEKGRVLVGSDADGIQLRVLAHLINDEEYTKIVSEGDVHTKNMEALGSVCIDRDHAKTFIYAFLLGAGTDKVAEILDCSNNKARTAMENFLIAIPGLRKLKTEKIPVDALSGFFVGLDGRKVICDSEHKMLAGYLQNYESTIMKVAVAKAAAEVKRQGLDCHLLNIVHDESLWDSSKEDADKLGVILEDSYRYAENKLNVKCPITGGYSKGGDWFDVH